MHHSIQGHLCQIIITCGSLSWLVATRDVIVTRDPVLDGTLPLRGDVFAQSQYIDIEENKDIDSLSDIDISPKISTMLMSDIKRWIV